MKKQPIQAGTSATFSISESIELIDSLLSEKIRPDFQAKLEAIRQSLKLSTSPPPLGKSLVRDDTVDTLTAAQNVLLSVGVACEALSESPYLDSISRRAFTGLAQILDPVNEALDHEIARHRGARQ